MSFRIFKAAPRPYQAMQRIGHLRACREIGSQESLPDIKAEAYYVSRELGLTSDVKRSSSGPNAIHLSDNLPVPRCGCIDRKNQQGPNAADFNFNIRSDCIMPLN